MPIRNKHGCCTRKATEFEDSVDKVLQPLFDKGISKRLSPEEICYIVASSIHKMAQEYYEDIQQNADW